MDKKIFGHQNQREILKVMLERKSLPHALLFAGPSGIGKSLVANELSISLLCEKGIYGGCNSCSACSLVTALNHPDFYRVECSDKSNWGVSEIRGLLYSLHLHSFSGQHRVVLLNDADYLTE